MEPAGVTVVIHEARCSPRFARGVVGHGQSSGQPEDPVDRDFAVDSPNPLWATDLTDMPTWDDTGYVCFIINAFRRKIVGWRVAAHMRTQMVLDAVEMATDHPAPALRAW